LEQPLFRDPVSSAPWRQGGYQEWLRRGGSNSATLARGILMADGAGVKFANPVHRTIEEVTGIADVPIATGVKGTEFRWSLAGVPKAIRRLIEADGVGRAYFTKYDDGWRVDNSMTSLNANPLSFANAPALPITPEEQNEIAADVAVELNKVEEARRQKVELEHKIEESDTPAQQIGDFKYIQLSREAGTNEIFQFGNIQTGTITNVGFTNAPNYHLWFGCIDSLQESEFSGAAGLVGGRLSSAKKTFPVLTLKPTKFCGSELLAFSSPEDRRHFLDVAQPALTHWRALYAAYVGKCKNVTFCNSRRCCAD